MNPEKYPIDLSQKCWDNKMTRIEEIKKSGKLIGDGNGGIDDGENRDLRIIL